MSYMFTVSPDFTPDHLSGWYIFNTWLQHRTGEAIHLEMYNDFKTQREAIQNDKIDLIYANPYDAAMLVREKGFLPLAKPVGISDEAIIAVSVNSHVGNVEHLQSGIKVAVTDDPGVRMMGMIMLEPADLDAGNIQLVEVDTYVLAAKQLLHRECEAGIFLAEAYDDLSNIIKKQLRILVRSQISVIHHALMIGPEFADKRKHIQNELVDMAINEKGRGVLDSLGFIGWEAVDNDEMELMIDVMDTLTM